MGYRKISIGVMTLAWTFIHMAIHMAQDLGMHRNADGWRCSAQDWDPSFLSIFSALELEELSQKVTYLFCDELDIVSKRA